MPIEITCVVSSRSAVGKGAVWAVRDQRLWWVEIANGPIHRYNPENSKNDTLKFGEPVGCIARRENSGLVVAAKSGFWFFAPETGQRQHICDPEAHTQESRFDDDGTVDSQGCYWQAGIEGWCLYRLSPQNHILQTVEVPVEKPTKPMFGGRNLDILYFTSLGQNVTGRDAQPEAGDLFAISGLGIKGVAQTRFAG